MLWEISLTGAPIRNVTNDTRVFSLDAVIAVSAKSSSSSSDPERDKEREREEEKFVKQTQRERGKRIAAATPEVLYYSSRLA